MEFLPPARAILLTGFMGTGKSTTGARLADMLGLAFVDTDDLVERAAGQSVSDVFAQRGEAAFRDLETEALRRALEGPRKVIATGGGMMLREENVALMRSAGPIICLEASPEAVMRRTSHRATRPLLRGDDPAGIVRSLLEQRREAYAQADHRVNADSDDRRIVLSGLMQSLARDPRTALIARRHAQVPVRADRAEYRIHIEHGAFRRLGRLCPAPVNGARCVVITATTPGTLYGECVMGGLREAGWEPALVTVPDGESTKTLETAAGLYDHLITAGVDSGGAVYALGGGVVGDLAGFVAATYRRGIRFVQLPTTLLAQVDASSGGKVAVNHPRGKNLIGAFHQPAGVIVDSATLETLPARDLRCGMAEVVKHALIADRALFEYLEAEVDAFMALDEVAVRYVLARNCQIKAAVVQQDPYDRGHRASLNYGHTVGHAVERAAGEWDLRHGEAVAVGMVAEARLAVEMGQCEGTVAERLTALLERVGLPTRAPGLEVEDALKALAVDKKMEAGKLRLPVVPEIGRVTVLTEVDPGALVRALEWVVDEAARGRSG